MATDATGSPTPLGIPKYNTSADAPSGLGFNAAMDSIDALIAARVNKPAGIATGDVPVWNGTTFVVPTGSRTGTKFLRDDGSWALAGGPGAPAITLPGSPTDTQQAILTDSTSAPTYEWLLQWSAALSKWLFLGGSPQLSEVDTSESRNSTSYGDTATVHSLTLLRAGLYEMEYGFYGDINSATNVQQFMSPKFSAAEAVDADAARFGATSGTFQIQAAVYRKRRITVAAASQVVTMRYKQGTASATSPVANRFLKVTPVTVT